MKILDILPPRGDLHTPHFRSRYQRMSEEYSFHILVTGDTTLDGDCFARARLYVQPPVEPWTRWRMIRRTWAMLVRGIGLARKEKIDVIVSYDPLTLGIIGTLIKLFSGAKLIVEVNGHIRNAKAASMAGKKVGFFRRTAFNLVGSMTLMLADGVKILNQEQFEEWRSILSRKKVFLFHDYTPTSQFALSDQDDAFLYCLGYPFYLKGVDVLLDAFSILQPKFPDTRLVIMGHCREPELSRWKARAQGLANVEFHKPVPYEQVAGYFSACSVFVLPSRSEGMGRVLIEAMATGKPCVGTRVGGIPNIIQDGKTGFLVAPENPRELTEKLCLLLADKELRQQMGEAGRRMTETILSDQQYVRNFQTMLTHVLDDITIGQGICFNGFSDSAHLESVQ